MQIIVNSIFKIWKCERHDHRPPQPLPPFASSFIQHSHVFPVGITDQINIQYYSGRTDEGSSKTTAQHSHKCIKTTSNCHKNIPADNIMTKQQPSASPPPPHHTDKYRASSVRSTAKESTKISNRDKEGGINNNDSDSLKEHYAQKDKKSSQQRKQHNNNSRQKQTINRNKRSNRSSDEPSSSKTKGNAFIMTFDVSASEYIPLPGNIDEGRTTSMQEEESEETSELESDLYQESFERASADLEILCAAYPEEIKILKSGDEFNESSEGDIEHTLPSWFPLILTLALPGSLDDGSPKVTQKFGGNLTMEFPKGYPSKKLQIISFRTSPSINKEYIEKVVACVQTTATEAVDLYGGEECGLQCCATAIECWTECLAEEQAQQVEEFIEDADIAIDAELEDSINWISAETTLVDRKSVFQAHVCIVDSDAMVKVAVQKLICGSSKIQRASHNMFAYRFVEKLEDGRELLMHDNDDDGEDAAGSRLAHLLEMRKEDGVLILVSRWYGGAHLGPKRFAHITNVARDLLVSCHDEGLLPNTRKI